MSDQAFVANANKAWKRVLALQGHMDGSGLAVAAGLWATMNADKLLEIAARKAKP